MEPHLIFAGKYYSKDDYGNIDRLKRFIRERMKIYQIPSVMVTSIYLKKQNLITQEKMESYSNGEYNLRRMSINDDLEILFEELQLGKKPSSIVKTYYLPKLTEHQMALVNSKDKNFFNTFYNSENADVTKKEMNSSVSNSKFILGECRRRTFRIKIPGESSSTRKKSCKCCVLQ